MKLVDKVKLSKAMQAKLDTFKVTDDMKISVSDLMELLYVMNEQPIVDAIPVDFIRGVLATGDLRDYKLSPGVKKIIELWEQENE